VGKTTTQSAKVITIFEKIFPLLTSVSAHILLMTIWECHFIVRKTVFRASQFFDNFL